MKKCNWNREQVGFAREVGCPLDHCPRGRHVASYGMDGTLHTDDLEPHDECWEQDIDECTCSEMAENCPGPYALCPSCQKYVTEMEVRKAERAAGWDPNP